MYNTLAGTASGTGTAAMAVLSFAACSFVPVFQRILGRVSRLIQSEGMRVRVRIRVRVRVRVRAGEG